MIDIDHLRQWIGREARERDVAAAGPLAGLAALLDRDEASPDGEVPPLGHWLYFLPRARQSDIAEDGHPRRGGLLPPVPLPRRMWAAGAVTFYRAIAIGEAIERRTTVRDVAVKTGASGDLVFVTLAHEIVDATGAPCIEERQYLVYRGGDVAPARVEPAIVEEARPSSIRREVRPDPVMLFRYSALTFNAHRIHYDRDYARDVEGYPGLVVHGPLSATLLIDHFLRETPGARVATFAFRARRPLFDTAPFTLHLLREADGASLWAADADGRTAVTASVTTR